MDQTEIYNLTGEKIGTAELAAKFFAVKVEPTLIHQLVVSELSNSRNVVAHSKTRGEVRGGGKKPWKQKGTGNARAGSIRSPLWKGGGVIFGPSSNRNFHKKINRQQFRKGLFGVLTDKLESKKLFVVDKFALDKIKTKDAVSVIKQLREKLKLSEDLAIVLSKSESNFTRSVKNVPTIRALKVEQLTTYNILLSDTIVFSKVALDEFAKTFAKA